MRFDDTNPAKENTEFENIILEDVKLLNIDYDIFSFTSNHFPAMLEYAEEMIKKVFNYSTSQNMWLLSSVLTIPLPKICGFQFFFVF